MGLQSASKLKVPELYIFSNSKLMVNQVTRKFEAQGAKMAKYLAVANNLITEFKAVKIEQERPKFTCRLTDRIGVSFLRRNRADHRSRVNLGP